MLFLNILPIIQTFTLPIKWVKRNIQNIYTLYPNVPICTSVTGPSYDNGTNQVNLNGEFLTTIGDVTDG